MKKDYKLLLVIKADQNDADYLEKVSEINDEIHDRIKPVMMAIKSRKERHNWPTSEYTNKTVEELYPELTEEQIEEFSEYVPWGDYGVHTINSIHVYDVSLDIIYIEE